VRVDLSAGALPNNNYQMLKGVWEGRIKRLMGEWELAIRPAIYVRCGDFFMVS
jgi:hypothetical protein